MQRPQAVGDRLVTPPGRFGGVSWGAVIATDLWRTGSGLFSFYVSSFGGYDQSYGSLAP